MKQPKSTLAPVLLGWMVGSGLAQEGPTLTVSGTGTATLLADHVQQGFLCTCTRPEQSQAEALCQQQAEDLVARIQKAGVAQDAILVEKYPTVAVAGPEGPPYQASVFLGVTLPISPETARATLDTLVKVKQAVASLPDVAQRHLTAPVGDYPRRVLLTTSALHPQSALTGLAWFIADGTVLEAEALRQAHAQSQEKAQRAAAALGWQIVGLKNLAVGDPIAPVGAMNSSQPARLITNYEEMELTLSVTVTATYQVKTGG